ncbi:hypothetical protein ACGFI9_33645 [Micromonospora sp. NPDC048930]|uniref:hypothetical protein n=1 Tax=Micromonospora sp. NPDC048930 TaxID=3364261 RepID=UPI0037143542
MGGTISINWDHLSQPGFDLRVEALLCRLYSDPDDEVRVYDGRGGDGGRDVVVRQGQRLRIFQLKYFRDGFGAERRTQRRQIANSFREAMAHQPDEWILVIPTNPTPGEERFVHELGADHPNLKIRILGRAELDNWFARHADLVDYFNRDQLREAAKIFQQEQAILAGGLADLTARNRELARVADTLDPHWAVRTVVDGDEVVHRIQAKHPHAHVVSPMTLTVSDDAFGPEHADLRPVLRRVIGFGTAERLILPPEITRNLTYAGPPWLPAPSGHLEIEAVPAELSTDHEVTARLTALASDGQSTASFQGTVKRAGRGHLGNSLTLKFEETATIQMLIGNDHQSHMDGNFRFTRAMPATVLQTIALYRSLQDSASIAFELDGQRIGTFNRDAPLAVDDEERRLLRITEMLADDLDVVQRHCRAYFPIPDKISVADRIDLRIARLLIEGHCVVMRATGAYTMTLNGMIDDTLRYLLNRETSVMRITSDVCMEIFGVRLELGPTTYFHAQIEIADRLDLLAELEAGRGAGRTMKIRPADGEPFRAFMPGQRAGRDDEPLETTGWGLPGLDGPRKPLIQ